MHRKVCRVKLDDNVLEVVENRQDCAQPPGKDLWPIWLVAAETDVLPDGVAFSTLGELAVMGNEDGTMLRRVDRLIVVWRICASGLCGRPNLVSLALERAPTSRIDIVVEIEPHLHFDRTPDRIEIIAREVRERLQNLGVR